MGRRSLHSPEELRRMILTSSREIVETDGMKGLSARAIAKKIGYSPGTLYNVFKNLDDLLITIQIALVEDAIGALKAVPAGTGPQDYVRALGRCYIDFALKNRRLWNLLFQHSPPSGTQGSELLSSSLASLATTIRHAVRPLMSQRSDADINEAAMAIWLSLHGMSAMAVSDQTSQATPEAVASYSAFLLDGALSLLERKQAS